MSARRRFHGSPQITMPKARPIYIDEGHGSYTRTEFRRLRNAEKLELMEAWFRERFEDPANDTPRWDGELGSFGAALTTQTTIFKGNSLTSCRTI
jgi:hypothetical protein